MMKVSKIFVCCLIASVILLSTTSGVFAANQNFIKQVSDDYSSYEGKISNEYRFFQQSSLKEYGDYQKDEVNSFEKFSSQTNNDLQYLDGLLKKDFESLQAQYDGNSSYSSKLRDYQNKINPNYLNSPMQKYANSINPNYLNSLMMKLKNATNESYLNSPMMKYKNAVNENYLNSPMMYYKNAVNENYLNSPMSKLKNGSNVNYTLSIMNQYNRGKISQDEAGKQWKELLQKEAQAIQTVKSQSTQSIQQIAGDSKDAILNQKYETVNGILKQREQSLETIAQLRKEYFGEEIEFNSLIPDLGKINVMIDGEWQAFKQPPTVMNGATLVPMRAIFEKLGAEVKWHAENQTITASKGSTTMSLVLNNNKAMINGKSITLPVAPRLIHGNTMVPLRFVSESLGAEVEWDGQNKTVFILAK